MFEFKRLLQGHRDSYTIAATSKDEVFRELAALRRLDRRVRALRRLTGVLLGLLILGILIQIPNGGVFAAIGFYPEYMDPELAGGVPFGNLIAIAGLGGLFVGLGRLRTVHPHPEGDVLQSVTALLQGLELQPGQPIQLILDLRPLDGGEFHWLLLEAVAADGTRIRIARDRVRLARETGRQRVSRRQVRVTYAVTDFWADTLTLRAAPEAHRAVGPLGADAQAHLPLPADAKVIGFTNDPERLALGLQSKSAITLSELSGLLAALAQGLTIAPFFRPGADGTLDVAPAPTHDGILLAAALPFIALWFGAGAVFGMPFNLAPFVPALYDLASPFDLGVLCPLSIVVSLLVAGALIAAGRRPG